MNRSSMVSPRSKALPKSKPGPVRGTPINQSGMLRRFSSNSDLSQGSESSSEDIYVSANEDETPNSRRSSYAQQSRNALNRSQSQAATTRTRSKSAGPRESQKDLVKTSPASLGRSVTTNLERKSTRKNSLSKSVNFGELKQNLSESQTNRKGLASNRLLPDKPKLFQRSKSMNTASVENVNTDGQHRPIICGKNRPRLSSSTSLSSSFDELPEPQADADMFEQMEMLFEEYRKLELGMNKRKSEEAQTNNSNESHSVQKQKSDTNAKTQHRGRKLSGESKPASTNSSGRASPSANMCRDNKSRSKPAANSFKTSTTKAVQSDPNEPIAAKAKPICDRSPRSQAKLVQSRDRAYLSPNNVNAQRPVSPTVTNITSSENVNQKDYHSIDEQGVSTSVSSRQSRPSSARPSKASSTRGREASPNRPVSRTRSTLHQAQTKAKSSSVTERPKSTSTSKASETQSSSLSEYELNRSNQNTGFSGRSSPCPQTEFKTCGISVATQVEHLPEDGFDTTPLTSDTAEAESCKSAPSKKVKAGNTSRPGTPTLRRSTTFQVKPNSRSDLRRSSESLSGSSKSDTNSLSQGSAVKVNMSSPRASPRTIPSPVSNSRGRSSPSPTVSNPSKSNATSARKYSESTVKESDGHKLTPKPNRRPSSAGRNTRPSTPTFEKTEPDGHAADNSSQTSRFTGMISSDNSTQSSREVSNKATTSKTESVGIQCTDGGELTESVKYPSEISKGGSASSIPNSPRGRTESRKTNKLNVASSVTRRSTSLQRSASVSCTNRNNSVMNVAKKSERPSSAKARSIVNVNKACDEKSQVGSKYLSGSHPELQKSGQPKPKLSKMDALHVQTQCHSQENVNNDRSLKPTNRRCLSSQEVYPSPVKSQPYREDKGAQTIDLTKDKDDLIPLSADDIFLSTARRDDKSWIGRKTRIPQPVSTGSSTKHHNPRQLKRCDSGVEINSMSPTESNANPDENWQDQNNYDFQVLNNTFDDSDDEYY